MSRTSWKTQGLCAKGDGHPCLGRCQSLRWMLVGGSPTCRRKTVAVLQSVTYRCLRSYYANCLAYLRAAIHQCSVANIAKLRLESVPHTTSQCCRSPMSGQQPILANTRRFRATSWFAQQVSQTHHVFASMGGTGVGRLGLSISPIKPLLHGKVLTTPCGIAQR